MINRPTLVAVLSISLILSASLISRAKALPINDDCFHEEGVWGNWTEWTSCTRSCGSGISTRTRVCLNGQCSGTSIQYRSCCVETCLSENADADFRAEQCEKRNYVDAIAGAFQYVPAADGNDGCRRLLCVNETATTPVVHSLSTYVLDGTACSRAKTGERGVCLGNMCAVVGCDGVLGSEKHEDKCLRCLSSIENASLCQRVHVNATYSSNSIVGNIVVLNLPTGATSVSITHPLRQNEGKLALRLSGQDPHIFNSHINSEYEFGQTTFHYKIFERQGKHFEVLFARGPLSVPVLVELINVSGTIPEVQYEYYNLSGDDENVEDNIYSDHDTDIDIHTDDGNVYTWQYGCFGSCSVTCGTGVQVSHPICKDTLYPNRELSDGFCLKKGMEKPFPIQRKCDIGQCPARWVVGEWSGCPEECTNENTYEHRKVGCYRSYEDGNSDLYVSNIECTGQTKPEDQRACTTRECYAVWTAGEWSECTGSCNGTQERNVHCVEVATNNRVDSSHCEYAQTKPAATQSCGTNCECYWRVTDWGNCKNSQRCGQGTKKRAVRCRYLSNNKTANESCCVGLKKPQKEQICYSTLARNCVLQWDIKPYGECIGECCKDQYQQRQVICSAVFDGILKTFPDELCDEIPKPATNQTCRRTDCPRWKKYDFGECSTSCGEGERQRQVKCMNNGEEVLEDLCTCTRRKPSEYVTCENSPCPTTTETPCIDTFQELCETVPQCGGAYRSFCCATCREKDLESTNS